MAFYLILSKYIFLYVIWIAMIYLLLLLFCLFRRSVRAAEGARLESVCTPQTYRGFESHLLQIKNHPTGWFFFGTEV